MDSEKKILKLAMIGCGGYAGYLIDRLAELPEICELLAVTAMDLDDPSAQACREKGISVYNSADELFENLSPETCSAVVIPTSIDSHYEYACKAVEHGYHVLLEKPPVSTIQDLDRLVTLQRESEKFIAVNFQYLYSDATQRIKGRLMDGEFGAIRSVKAHALWMRPESYFARSHWSGHLQFDGRWVLDGTIGNPLAHLVAEVLYLATPKAGMAVPANMQAELYRANRIESEDTSCFRLQTEEGVSVFYTASLCSKKVSPILCEVETDQALIRLFDYAQIEIIWTDGRIERDEISADNGSQDRHAMLRVVLGNLAKNERPLVTVEECRPYMLAWNGAFESAGQPVRIAEEAIFEKETDQGSMRVVRDIESLSLQAFRQQNLFSELGVNWAAPRDKVELAGYRRFPSNNRVLMSRENRESAVV